MERERIPLAPGVSLYREGLVWMVDFFMKGDRMRKSLRTQDRWKALGLVASYMGRDGTTAPVTPPAERFAAPQANVLPLGVTGPAVFQLRPPPGFVPLSPHAQAAVMVHASTGAAVKDAIDEYLADQDGMMGNSKAHTKNVRKQLEKFVAHAGVTRVEQIGTKHVRAYLNACATQGQSAKTRKDKLGILGAWMRWCRSMKYVAADPTEGMKAPRVRTGDVRYLTSAEVTKLLQAAEGSRVEVLIKMGLFTGLRRKELLGLTAEQIDLTGRSIRLKSSKTLRTRSVPVFDQTLPVIMRLPRTGKLFEISASGYLCRQVREVFAAAGLQGLGLQTLRRTFATHLLLAGVDPYHVARWLGHDITVQQRHYGGFRQDDRPMELRWFGAPIPKSGVLEIPKEAKENR